MVKVLGLLVVAVTESEDGLGWVCGVVRHECAPAGCRANSIFECVEKV